MKVTLNGEAMETLSATLLDLVLEQTPDLSAMIVEYNYQVVKQDEWTGIEIKDGDNIEVLSFVEGG